MAALSAHAAFVSLRDRWRHMRRKRKSLVELAACQPSPCKFELPMTRADIGDFLGLTIETVSRTFTKLRMLGLFELPQSSRVKLVDLSQLQSLAAGAAGEA